MAVLMRPHAFHQLYHSELSVALLSVLLSVTC